LIESNGTEQPSPQIQLGLVDREYAVPGPPVRQPPWLPSAVGALAATAVPIEPPAWVQRGQRGCRRTRGRPPGGHPRAASVTLVVRRAIATGGVGTWHSTTPADLVRVVATAWLAQASRARKRNRRIGDCVCLQCLRRVPESCSGFTQFTKRTSVVWVALELVLNSDQMTSRL
jgi:hypothetical protein